YGTQSTQGPAPPRQFGNYEILSELGHGAMGVVYQARQRQLDRVVALKMIRSSCLATQDEVNRFDREARAPARLRHPNIVAVHEVGEVHGHLYFAMDLVQGESLAEKLTRGPVTAEQAARLLQTIAAAVEELHRHEIVHRDL